MPATTNTPLARLLRAVQDYDARINAAERIPTGDDYNRLFSMIRELAERATAPLPLLPQPQPEQATVYECPDCDWTGTMDEIDGLHHVHHINERIEPGELVPAGVCPECRALIAVDDRDVPHHTLYIVGNIMRARGWTVAAPADYPSLDPAKGA